MTRTRIVFLLFILMVLTSCSKRITPHTIVVGSIRDGILLESMKAYGLNDTGSELSISLPFQVSQVRRADWSPDTDWIAYQTNDSNSEIIVVNANGQEKLLLTNNSYPRGLEPTWAPDSKRIAAYFRHANGENGIYVVNVSCILNTSNCTPEYHFVAEGRLPSWSPDGSQIAFRTSSEQVAVVSVEFPESEKIITPEDVNCYGLAWSPVHNEIAVSCSVENGINIFLVNSDGSNFRNITKSESGDLLPIWSPDGTKIAFVSDRFGSRPIIYHGISSNAVYIMEKDGSNVKRLSPYDDESIQWIDWIAP